MRNASTTTRICSVRAAAIILIWMGLFVANGPSQDRIELEIAIDRSGPITGPQKWSSFLGQLGIRNKFHSTSSRVAPSKRLEKNGKSSIYRITGVLTSSNRLRLPGGTFRLGDRTGIEKWRDAILKPDGGIENTKRTRFGLTAKQLVGVHRSLAPAVEHSTRDKRVLPTLSRLLRKTRIAFHINAVVPSLVPEDSRVQEELQGLSVGTAVAAILKPYRVALVPHMGSGKRVELWVTPLDAGTSAWPVGWPPKEKTMTLVPKMYERLEVEIVDTPLSDTLAALEQRIGIPFLLDRGNLNRHKIDPRTHLVQFPSGETFYKRVIVSVCSKAALTTKLRVDESGKPFLWITTRRR